MKKITLTLITSIAVLFSLKADCTFQSFAIGEEFEIGNMLVWTTSEELDNKLFIIEKSTTGVDFEEIGEVAGAGSSEEEISYRFMDLDARKGMSYYRIKQIDFDDDFGYSSTVIVNKSTENNFMVSSINNPLDREQVELTVDFVEAAELIFAIKDMKGDLLEENSMAAIAGLQNLTFDLSNYPNGSYKLVLQSGEEEETITIRKTNSVEETKTPVAKKD